MEAPKFFKGDKVVFQGLEQIMTITQINHGVKISNKLGTIGQDQHTYVCSYSIDGELKESQFPENLLTKIK